MKDRVTDFLVDPRLAVTIQIWDDFIPQGQDGGTYTFKNSRVHKNWENGTLFVAIPNGCQCTTCMDDAKVSLLAGYIH